VIGEPTGETATFYTEPTIFELPYSKLNLQCATSLGTSTTGSSNDQWIEPDIYVDLDKMELNAQTLNMLLEQTKKEYPHFFNYVTKNTSENKK
jgi:hypothetical protein